MPMKTAIRKANNENSQLHDFFKAEKSGSVDISKFISQIMFFAVRFAKKFHDRELAFIYIKMDVAPVKIGCTCFPDFRIGVMFFDRLPRSLTDLFIQKIFENKQQFQRIFFPRHPFDDRSTRRAAVGSDDKHLAVSRIKCFIKIFYRRYRRGIGRAEAVNNALRKRSLHFATEKLQFVSLDFFELNIHF